MNRFGKPRGVVSTALFVVTFVCLCLLVAMPATGQQVVNVDFRSDDDTETYEGDNGRFSTPGGEVWNPVQFDTNETDLLDEFGVPTPVDVEYPAGGYFASFLDDMADNELQDTGTTAGFQVLDLVAGETYDLAIYASPGTGLGLTHGAGGFGGHCNNSGDPTYDLPGVQGQDYCLFWGLVPYDVGGGRLGIVIDFIDGQIVGIQLHGDFGGGSTTCVEDHECPVGQICSAASQCVDAPSTIGTNPDPDSNFHSLVEGQDTSLHLSFHAEEGDLQVQDANVVFPDAFEFKPFNPLGGPLGFVGFDLDEDGVVDVTYDILADPDDSSGTKAFVDVNGNIAFDRVFEPRVVQSDGSIILSIHTPSGDGNPETLEVPQSMRISVNLNPGIITPMIPGSQTVAFTGISVDPDTGKHDDGRHNHPLSFTMDYPAEILPDRDGDGIPDDADGCPDDGNKAEPGLCGCGTPDTDSDGDQTPDCNDNCPDDPDKVDPGTCDCGTPDTDSDGDQIPDCNDNCPADPNKVDPGICGCGESDADSDMDGTPDCNDNCPDDPNKVEQGPCGCGVADIDSDGDETPDCNDGCPDDGNKVEPGICGCGVSDNDSDGDQTPDCNDGCPDDPNKVESGICDCGVADTDSDGDNYPVCLNDCNDDDASIHPGAEELCDEVDNNCDGQVDEGCSVCDPSLYIGDLDDDCDIDRDDVGLLLGYRNQPASQCLECDLDGDGTVTVLDARMLVLQCTRPRCATE